MEEESRNHKREDKKPFLEKGRLQLFLWFFLCVVFWECLLRIVQSVPFFGAGLLFILLFGAALAFLLTAICSLLPPKIAFILALVFMGLLATVYVIQMFYYFMFKTYLTIFSIVNGMDALQFGGNIWATLKTTWPLVACALAPFLLFAVFAHKIPFTRSYKGAGIMAIFAVALQFTAIGCLYPFGTGYFTPYDYYYENPSLNQSVDKLGMLTTFRLDVQRYLVRGEDVPNEEPAAPAAQDGPAATPAVPRKTPAPLPTHTPAPTPEATMRPEDYPYNELDIDFTTLAQSTDDSTLKEMHEYFASVPPTRQNEKTGIYKGYNLITITAESFAPYAIDEKLTPTLYKMQQEGYNFTNFYCPEWGVSTSDGEYVNCVGLIPKHGVWTLYLAGKRGNLLPFTMGNQLSALGYKTNAYHNNTYTYYSRDISHPNMGYTYKGIGNGLEVEQTWPESDLEMVDVTTPEYVGPQPFHTYYMTVSGHMEYNWGGNDMSIKHRSLVENLPLSDPAKAYLACNIELDRAMELLLKRLEEAGVAEKTLIAIAPDHPPYGLEYTEISEFLGHDIERTFEYNESVFLLYNPGQEPETVDKYCCTMDIIPTISNMMGLPYDSRLLMGRDIFSNADSLVILGDRSWITDAARFNSNSGEATPAVGTTVDEAYVEEINKIIADKFKYSPMIFENDYYRVVLEG